MGNHKLRGKDLRKINFKDNENISLAMNLMSKHYKHSTKEQQLNLLSKLLWKPEEFQSDPVLSVLAERYIIEDDASEITTIDLAEETKSFRHFGRSLISEQAYDQMQMAMQLPVAERGALMPDAHHGYGLPIGGVLATRNQVIPYAVGVDIGCRMSLSLYDIDAKYLNKNEYLFKQAIKERTNFGTGGIMNITQEHEILDREEFRATALLRSLHGKAAKQLGTSGSGNHFVEFGIVHLSTDNGMDLPAGEYVGLLAHSGSRGTGAMIAQHYTEIAMQKCMLPRQVKHLAWLDLQTQIGQEYWLSMNLAGDYAKACHDQIHKNVSKYAGIKPIAKIENHHNFAWKEQHDGQDYIVHRKGATPAAKGEMGIIPGSMTAPAYVVRGKGNVDALSSASHGAGRRLSRTKTKASYTASEMRKYLKQHKVSLIGGGVDEAPIAYKDIDEVMRYQTELVEVVGKFQPRIVRMDKP